MVASANAEFALINVLDEHGRSRPDELAVVDGEIRLTYSQLSERVSSLASGLTDIGLGQGDRVLWLGLNSFRVLEAALAVQIVGASLCPVNWRESPAELEFVLDDLDPSAVLWQDVSEIRLSNETRQPRRPDQRWVRADDDTGDYGALLASRDRQLSHEVDAEATALILYTAAHDGQPNGAQLSNRSLFNAGVIHGIANAVYDERPCFLASGPLFHVATLMGVVATFLAGGTNVFVPKVDVDASCQLIEDERCTWAYFTGPTIGAIASRAKECERSLPSLLVPGSYVAADPRWSHLGRPSTSPWSRDNRAFGQTETAGVLTYAALAGEAIGRAGRPSAFCHVRIVDPVGHDADLGEVGEIVARGPLVGNGYWNRPELNQTRIRDGWWYTNDLGRREIDGSLSFIGPKTRMIKSGKENIYPVEVERCLLAHPDIVDAAALGVPDSEWEQAVKVIIVRQPGSTLSEQEVIEHCRTAMASYKKPKFVEFVDAIPRVGFAVDRDELDRRFGGGGYVGLGVAQ